MNLTDLIKGLYLGYAPLDKIAQEAGMSMEDIGHMVEPYIILRAEKSLNAIDMTQYTDEPPIIKALITKLSIMRNELFRRAHSSFEVLTLAETIDNYIKKVKINDEAEWIDISEEVEIISETGSYVSAKWIYLAEHAENKAIVAHARILMNKFLMRPDSLIIYEDWDTHIKNCERIGIDPKQHSEDYVRELEEELEEAKEELDNLKDNL